MHVGSTVSICDEDIPCQPFKNLYTTIRRGRHDGGQLRPESYSYTVTPSHGRSNLQRNKREAQLSCYVALFSKKRPFSLRLISIIAFPCSSVIHVSPHLMLPTLDFKTSLSTISIKNANEMPLWNFCTRHFEYDNKDPIVYHNDNVARSVEVDQ